MAAMFNSRIQAFLSLQETSAENVAVWSKTAEKKAKW